MGKSTAEPSIFLFICKPFDSLLSNINSLGSAHDIILLFMADIVLETGGGDYVFN